MASISKRPSKSGMTYRIQIKIKDKGSGEIKVHSTTWKPPVGLTPKQMEREVVIFASEYENAIKALETASGEPTQSAETTFSDYALWWLKRRKNEVAASYFVNCESAIELTNKHIGGYKLKELTPNIIQQYYDKLDRMEKTVTVVTAKPALRERMKQTGIGYMKLRYEKNFSSCSLSNALAGKQISYELTLNMKAKDLSLGNKKKMNIVMALLSSPKLIVLDEPTLGLDPIIKQNLYEILLDEKKRGASILISSHQLTEVQRLCDRVAVIKDGKVIAIEEMENLKTKRLKRVTFETSYSKPQVTLSGVTDLKQNANVTSFNFNGDMKNLIKYLSSIDLVNLDITECDLESIFLHFYE